MIKKYFIAIILFPLWGMGVYAQEKEKDTDLPKGNESFAEKKYDDAEAEYRISESKNKKKSIASYNLGNAVYKQNQAAEAKYHYAEAIKNAKTKEEKHTAYHNIGNTFMKEKDYSKAVEAYKDALRNGPADEQTRYNLALAKQLLEKNPPKGKDDKKKGNNPDKQQQQKKEQEENKDKNQKDKDQNQNQQNQKEKKEEKKEENNNNPEQMKPQPGGVSKQRIENLLDAINNEEKKVQDKVNKQKVMANPGKPQKDW